MQERGLPLEIDWHLTRLKTNRKMVFLGISKSIRRIKIISSY